MPGDQAHFVEHRVENREYVVKFFLECVVEPGFGGLGWVAWLCGSLGLALGVRVPPGIASEVQAV